MTGAGGSSPAEDAADRREGRGRLSSIDLLPEDADEDVAWANNELRAKKLPQTTIFAEFNARLIAKDIAPISKSAWSRYAVRKAIQFRRLDEANRLFSDIAASLGTDSADQATVGLAELLKLAMFELLEDGQLNAKSVMELSRGLSSVVGAQKASADHRRKLQEEMLAKVDKAIDKAASEPGDTTSAEQVLKRIREDVYGIFAS